MHAEALRLLDCRLFLAVNRIHGPAWEMAMAYGTDLGYGLVLAVLLALGLRVWDPRRFPKNFLLIGLAALVAGIAVNVAKELVPRSRPLADPHFALSERPVTAHRLPGGRRVVAWQVGSPELAAVAPRLQVMGPRLKHHSFPSGHTAAAFAVAAGLIYASRGRRRWLWLAPAAFVGVSRVACGVHFPSDVAVGAALGVAASLGLLRPLERFHGLATRPAPPAPRAAPGPLRVMFVAGEASADVYGARLLAALRRREPGLEAFGVGGPLLEEAGLALQAEARELEIVGFTAVLARLPTLARIYGRLYTALRERQPDVLVCIDLPDFNAMLALQARALGIPVLFYIGPQLWAWRPGRIDKLAARISHMVVAFPFERALYVQAGVPVSFHGHPLLETLPEGPAGREQTLARFGLDPARELVVLAPGSRGREWRYHLAPLLTAARRIAEARPGVQFAVPVAPHRDPALLERAAREAGVEVVATRGAIVDVFAAARLGLVCSGTATLEAALAGLPMVIFYRGNWINALLVKSLLRTRHVGLPNIVLGDDASAPYPELLQHRASGEHLAAAALALLDDDAALAALHEAGSRVRARLAAGDTSEAVAGEVLALAAARG